MRGAHTLHLPHVDTRRPHAAHTPPTRRPSAACASLVLSSRRQSAIPSASTTLNPAFAFRDAQVLSLNEALKAQDTARYAVVQELRSNSQVFFLNFAHRTHFSHMPHPTFPISHL